MADPSLSSKELFARIQPVISKELDVPVEKVIPTARFVEDLGADSLDTVELIMSLEETLDIQIPTEEAEKLATVQDLLVYLEPLVRRKSDG